MTYLIDTHALIWFIAGCKELNQQTIAIITDKENIIYISQASLWEIAIKLSLGKLEMTVPFEELERYLEENNFLILDFDFMHLKALLTLPFHHNDPFDRLIISQAIVEDFPIITHDHFFFKYPVKIVLSPS